MTDELDSQIGHEAEEESDELIAPDMSDEEQAERVPAQAVSARRPGWLAQMGNRVAVPLSRIDLPQWNWRTFLYGLAVLVIFILIWRNWVDVRLDLILWRFDIPKSIVIVACVLLGAGLMRAWEMCCERRVAKTEDAQEDDQRG